MPRRRPIRLFVSYSHRDEKYLEELRKYLEPERGLDVWSDERIQAGAEWRQQIGDALADADAAVLLVSQDFLNSAFIRNHELPSLLESVRRRRLRLFLIPIGACLALGGHRALPVGARSDPTAESDASRAARAGIARDQSSDRRGAAAGTR